MTISTNYTKTAPNSTNFTGGQLIPNIGATMNSASYTMNDTVLTLNDLKQNTLLGPSTNFTTPSKTSTNWTRT